MNSNQINRKNILVSVEQNLEKKKENFSNCGKIMNSCPTNWNNILVLVEQKLGQEGTKVYSYNKS
jgi:hypothetical protein